MTKTVREVVFEEAVRMLNNDGLRFGGGCGNRDCKCAVPGLPCAAFVGNRETGLFCPRCGWEEKAHR